MAYGKLRSASHHYLIPKRVHMLPECYKNGHLAISEDFPPPMMVEDCDENRRGISPTACGRFGIKTCYVRDLG